MNRKAKWVVAGAIVGLAAIVGAGAVTVQRRQAQEEAERKGAKPPLEFAQSDVVRLQRRKLTVEAGPKFAGDAEATKGAADEADDALLEAGWTVGTTQVNITQKTTISDAPAPKVGDAVDVTGVKLPDGALIASTITRE